MSAHNLEYQKLRYLPLRLFWYLCLSIKVYILFLYEPLRRPVRNFSEAYLNLFQLGVVFRIETSHLICSTNQMTGFYTKCNTGLKWVTGADFRMN